MNQTYLLIDLTNVFFRARHVTRGDLDDKVGLSIHTVFSSIRKAWRDFKATHTVVCLEGRSWRKDVYPPYKRQRAESRAALSPKEAEEEEVFWETLDQFKDFIINRTNCTVLHNPVLEADDLIAGWIRHHPNDNHVIISTDGDFAQLVSHNVRQYNGVTGVTTTIDGYFDEKGKPVIDNKTKEAKAPPDPSWLLFEKCMRGDTSDNIFSAYPGVRTKGTKNKIGLLEAYADRNNKGYSWNNLMLQRWIDHDGIEHRVIDDFQRNVQLCDLNAQPDHIKAVIDQTIFNAMLSNKDISHVGIRLLKFCSTYDLVKITEQVESYTAPLNAKYQKVTHEHQS